MENIKLNNFMGATKRIDENKKKYKIKFLVTSHKSYYQIALPVILQSMIEQILPEDILVVIGGMDKEKNFMHQGIEIQYVKYNDWDHTGFSYLAFNWDKYKTRANYWFNLHDTCKCASYFSELVYNFPPEIESYALWDTCSFNIGLYKSTYLEKIKSKILRNHEQFKIMKKGGSLIFEDKLWHLPKAPRPAYGRLHNKTPGYCGKAIKVGLDVKEGGYDYVYKDDMRRRRIQYFIDVGLFKYKSGLDAAMGFDINKRD